MDYRIDSASPRTSQCLGIVLGSQKDTQCTNATDVSDKYPEIPNAVRRAMAERSVLQVQI